jgi:hypothetical protein
VVAVWEDYLSGAYGGLRRNPPFSFMDVAGDAGSPPHVYSVVIRDTIPLEDEKGLMPLRSPGPS